MPLLSRALSGTQCADTAYCFLQSFRVKPGENFSDAGEKLCWWMVIDRTGGCGDKTLHETSFRFIWTEPPTI